MDGIALLTIFILSVFVVFILHEIIRLEVDFDLFTHVLV